MKKLLLLALLASPFFGCEKAEKSPNPPFVDHFSLLSADEKLLVGHWKDDAINLEGSDIRTFSKLSVAAGTENESVRFESNGSATYFPDFWYRGCVAPMPNCPGQAADEAGFQPESHGSWTLETAPDDTRTLTQNFDDGKKRTWLVRSLDSEKLTFSEL